MASVLVQFRTENKKKEAAITICEKLGIELQDYLRICISRLISEGGIPFSMNVDEMETIKSLNIIDRIRESANQRGISNMSMEEIDKEIEEVRSKRNKN